MSVFGDFVWHLREFDFQIYTPIVTSIEKYVQLDFQSHGVMFTQSFFLTFIAAIVIYSMIMTDVEERTYEFAMLRTLGFKTTSLITLITVQTLLFAVPATVIGFILLYIFNVTNCR